MQKLDPKSVWLFFISGIIKWFFIIVFGGLWLVFAVLNLNKENIDVAPDDSLNWPWLLLIIGVLIALSYLWAKLTYHFYRYELTDMGFRKESGVIWKSYVTIPYDRIQNVDIYRGVWARILGLSDLQVQTAGSSAVVGRYGGRGINAEGRLPAISKQVAEQIRDELLTRSRNSRTGQGL